jgi:hypothetical protein
MRPERESCVFFILKQSSFSNRYDTGYRRIPPCMQAPSAVLPLQVRNPVLMTIRIGYVHGTGMVNGQDVYVKGFDWGYSR